eukprot:TRINITY_DN14215_c0_g1_i1.p1 TRINITY_DN14215_c0_g1~~TRINITY_DN14215_c0_g1_i1.p1  ORF type:complete len:105 (+),score=3.14 TRINITY_DN14215_c0_g1_i1:220-534(+)
MKMLPCLLSEKLYVEKHMGVPFTSESRDGIFARRSSLLNIGAGSSKIWFQIHLLEQLLAYAGFNCHRGLSWLPPPASVLMDNHASQAPVFGAPNLSRTIRSVMK